MHNILLFKAAEVASSPAQHRISRPFTVGGALMKRGLKSRVQSDRLLVPSPPHRQVKPTPCLGVSQCSDVRFHVRSGFKLRAREQLNCTKAHESGV